MNEMLLASTPDNIDPAVGIPVAIILWSVLLIGWRRRVIRARRAERLAREAMMEQYEASLRRSGWGE